MKKSNNKMIDFGDFKIPSLRCDTNPKKRNLGQSFLAKGTRSLCDVGFSQLMWLEPSYRSQFVKSSYALFGGQISFLTFFVLYLFSTLFVQICDFSTLCVLVLYLLCLTDRVIWLTRRHIDREFAMRFGIAIIGLMNNVRLSKTRTDLVGAMVYFGCQFLTFDHADQVARRAVRFVVNNSDKMEPQSATVPNIPELINHWSAFRETPEYFGILKTILYVICVPIASKMGSENDCFESNFDRMFSYLQKKVSKKEDIFHTVVTTLHWICDRGYQVFLTGDLTALYMSKTEAVNWISDASSALADEQLIHDCKFTPEEFVLRLRDLIEDGKRIQKFVAKRSFELSLVSQYIFKLESTMKRVQATLSSSRSRTAPFALLINGPPAIGKSNVAILATKMFFSVKSSLLGTENTFDYSENTFSKNSFEKFWSGYSPSVHKAVNLDDLSSLSPHIMMNNTDCTETQLISIINTVGYVTNQAELANKGNIPFRSEIVIGTTNVKHLNAYAIASEPSAILRRFKYVLTPRVKKRFQGNKTHTIETVSFDPDVWDFKLEKVRILYDESSNRTSVHYDNVFDEEYVDAPTFWRKYRKIVEKHFECSENSFAAENVDCDLCETCELPSFICSCSEPQSSVDDLSLDSSLDSQIWSGVLSDSPSSKAYIAKQRQLQRKLERLYPQDFQQGMLDNCLTNYQFSLNDLIYTELQKDCYSLPRVALLMWARLEFLIQSNSFSYSFDDENLYSQDVQALETWTDMEFVLPNTPFWSLVPHLRDKFRRLLGTELVGTVVREAREFMARSSEEEMIMEPQSSEPVDFKKILLKNIIETVDMDNMKDELLGDEPHFQFQVWKRWALADLSSHLVAKTVLGISGDILLSRAIWKVRANYHLLDDGEKLGIDLLFQNVSEPQSDDTELSYESEGSLHYDDIALEAQSWRDYLCVKQRELMDRIPWFGQASMWCLRKLVAFSNFVEFLLPFAGLRFKFYLARKIGHIKFFSLCLEYRWEIFYSVAGLSVMAGFLFWLSKTDNPMEAQATNFWHQHDERPLDLSPASSTSQTDSLLPKLQRAVYHAEIITTRKTQFCLFNVKGNCFIGPDHAIPDGKFKLSLASGFRTGGLKEQFTVDVEPYHVRRLSNDLCLVFVAHTRPGADLRKFLIGDEWRNCHSYPGFLVGRDRSTSLNRIFLAPNTYKTLDGKIFKGTFPSYAQGSDPTQKGDCGRPLVLDVNGKPAIVGFHICGNNVRGASAVLDTEEFDKALDSLSIMKMSLQGDFKKALDNHKDELHTIHPKSVLLHKSVSGNALVFGSSSHHRVKLKSHVQKTPIYYSVKKYFPCMKIYSAPAMQGFLNKNVWCDPWLQSVKQSSSMANIPYSMVKLAAAGYFSDIQHLFKSHKPLSHFESINGIDQNPHINRVPTSTSAGFPFSGPKIRKMYEVMNVQHELCYDVDEDIKTMQYEYIQCYLRGERAYPVFKAHLKDEPRAIEKVRVGNTRVFSGCPLAFTLLVRKYFLPYAVDLLGHDESEMMIGVNHYSGKWGEYYDLLTQFGSDRIVAGDYAKFDKRMPSYVIFEALNVIIKRAELDYDADDIKIMRGIATDIALPLINIHGDYVMYHGGNPSGHPMTTFVNSIVNSIYMRCAFAQLEDLPVYLFQTYVKLLTYGDDNIMGVSTACSTFSHTSVQECFQKWDLGYTMADKGAESVPFIKISDAEILKRGFRFDLTVNRWVAPLAEESIVKSLSVWLRSKVICSNEQLALIFLAAKQEWLLYPQNIFVARFNWLSSLIDEVEGLREYLHENFFLDREAHLQELYTM